MDNYKAFNTLLTRWPFIKVPPIPRHLKCLGLFNPVTYSYLWFDNVDYTPEPETAETAYR